MPQPKCPFCFNKHDFKKSYICPNSFRKENPEENEVVPPEFIKQYDRVPPLSLVTMGFKQHGKTTYLAALTMVLENLYRILPGTTYQLLDQYTVETVAKMRQNAITGNLPGPSEIAVPRPMFVNIYGGLGPNCLVLYDVAGEIYHSVYENSNDKYIQSLKTVKNVLFMVSLKDLEEDEYILRINDLLLRYIEGMQHLQMPVANHNLIVVFTKGDKMVNLAEYGLPGKVNEHFLNDPFQKVTKKYDVDILTDFRLDDYMTELQEVSDLLKDYTRRVVPGGGAFIDLAELNHIGLYFTITSATGDNPVNNRLQQEATRYCVLDPYFWALRLNEPLAVSEIHLFLDGTKDSECIYAENLTVIYEELSTYGDVTTHYLGQSRIASIAGQAPPTSKPRVPRPRLVGPILEKFDENSLSMALTGGEILDLQDFVNSTWQERLLLVAFGDEEFQPWANQIIFRKGDNLSLVTEQFRQLIIDGSSL